MEKLRVLLYVFSALAIALGAVLLLDYSSRGVKALAVLGIAIGLFAPIAYGLLARRE